MPVYGVFFSFYRKISTNDDQLRLSTLYVCVCVSVYFIWSIPMIFRLRIHWSSSFFLTLSLSLISSNSLSTWHTTFFPSTICRINISFPIHWCGVKSVYTGRHHMSLALHTSNTILIDTYICDSCANIHILPPNIESSKYFRSFRNLTSVNWTLEISFKANEKIHFVIVSCMGCVCFCVFFSQFIIISFLFCFIYVFFWFHSLFVVFSPKTPNDQENFSKLK